MFENVPKYILGVRFANFMGRARAFDDKNTPRLRRIFCLIYLRDFVLPAAERRAPPRRERLRGWSARYFICGAVCSNAGGKNCPINYTRDSVIVTSTIFHVTFLFITKGRARASCFVPSTIQNFPPLGADLRGKMLSAHHARAAIYKYKSKTM